jgi:RNA polymerase sigma-70 factor, ECF subfamily
VSGVTGRSLQAALTAAVGGDEQAFAVLWRELQPAVLRYLRVLAPDAAEDLASETWVRVIAGLGRFRGDEHAFRAWLFTVARHRAIDRWRRAARGPTEPVPLEALVDREAPDDPAAEAVDAIGTRDAVAMIASLPTDQAEVVLLRVVGGLDVAEVARIVGKRPGTVRVLSHRALRRLAERLGQDARVRGAV